MKLFDTRPQLFQFFFGVIALLCIAAAAINLYNLTASPTDENLFIDPPSFLIVSHNADGRNGIQTGDIILEVEKQPGKTETDTVLKVTVLKPATNTRTTSVLTAAEFKALTIRNVPPYVLVVGIVEGGASDRVE